MRFLVAPEFTNKLASLTKEEIHGISKIVNHIKESEKTQIITKNNHFNPRQLTNEIFIFDANEYKIYASFGSDNEGEYVLLLDIAAENNKQVPNKDFFSTNDPRTNPNINPDRNPNIDPRRNMMIDPHRNMMIDPQRNMMIDPRRNMMIDPNRNMMIDPRRNMMIDPRRNMMIDPNRNTLIDPRRNRSYGGPFLYDTKLNQIGFLVRANEQVSLIFNKESIFEGISVSTPQGNRNTFNQHNIYTEFWAPTSTDLLNRFDLNGNWIGVVI